MRKAAINLTLAIQGLQNLGEVFGIPDVVHPQMKTKQIPDDFRDWIEAQTFEIVARVAWPPRLPLNYLKRTIIRQPAGGPPIDENAFGDLEARDDASLDCLPDFPAVSQVRRYSLRDW